MADEEKDDLDDSSDSAKEEFHPARSARQAKKNARLTQLILKNERNAIIRRISTILKKSDEERTKEERELLDRSPEITTRLRKQALRRHTIKQRHLEIEDADHVLEQKCQQLAAAIRRSSKVVIYTGAGISTAASIPDYRGPNGVWTLLQKGQMPKAQDLSDAEPTSTHMIVTKLYREGHVKHVVSQNCDGLHIRSGLSRDVLSEVHGNMFIEVCSHCRPQKEYIRLFDVTEKTGVRRHHTERNCHTCGKSLKDTIVHFGEKGGMKPPYRWKEAAKAANSCDVILCLGTSLKILKKYPCLWCMHRRMSKRPDLYIVNLQWTPKDDVATLKINGRCDDIMERVMKILGLKIPVYKKEEDPLFRMHTPLKQEEGDSTSKKILSVPNIVSNTSKDKGLSKTEDVHFSSPVPCTETVNTVKQDCDQPPRINGTLNNKGTPKPGVPNFQPKETFIDLTQGDDSSPPSMPPNTSSIPSIPPPLAGLPPLNWPFLPMLGGLNGMRPFAHPPNLLTPLDFLMLTHLAALHHQSQSSSQTTGTYQTCQRCQSLKDSSKPNTAGAGDICTCSKETKPVLPPLPPLLSQLGGLFPFHPIIPLRNGLPQMPPLNGIWPTPLQTSASSTQAPKAQPKEVQNVLKDHCYLNKAQMQRLSPKGDTSATCKSSTAVKPLPDGGKVAESTKIPAVKLTSSSRNVACIPKLSTEKTRASTVSSMSESAVREENRKLISPQRFEKPSVKDNVRQGSEAPCVNAISGNKPVQKIGQTVHRASHKISPSERHSADSATVSSEMLSHKVPVFERRSVDSTSVCSEDIDNTQMEEEEEEEGEGKPRKRKLKRSVSVPGWFGKGLNLKRKRKY